MAKGFNINVQLLAQTQQFNRNIGKAGNTLKKLKGIVVGAFAVQAVAQFGKSVLSTAGDFENAMARVGAVSNASERDMKALTDVARKMGATTQYSATQAAEGLQKLAMAGLSAGDQIKALPSVLNLATVGAIGLGEASDIATNIMSGFGKKAEDLEGVVDIMAKTITKSNTGILELGEAMSYAAPTANLMGVSIEQVSTLLATMANNGVKGSRAGTALNSTMLRLAAPTKEAATALEGVGISLEQLAKFVDSGNIIGFFDHIRTSTKNLGASDKGAVLDAVFGKVQAGAVGTILNSTKEQVRALFVEINDSAGVASKVAAKSMGQYTKSVKTLNSAYESLLITLGSGDGASNAVNGLTGIVRALEKIADTIPVVNIAFAGMLTYLGRGYINSGASGLKGIYTSIKDVTKAQNEATEAAKKSAKATVAVNAAQQRSSTAHNNTLNSIYGVKEAKQELADVTNNMSVADKKARVNAEANIKRINSLSASEQKSVKSINQKVQAQKVLTSQNKLYKKALNEVSVAENELASAQKTSKIAHRNAKVASGRNVMASVIEAQTNRKLVASNLAVVESKKAVGAAFSKAGKAAVSFGVSTLKMLGSMALLTAAIGAISKAVSVYSEWREELDKYNKVSREYIDNVRNEGLGLKLLVDSINSANTKSEVRKNLIKQFNSKYGEYIKNLLTEKSTLEEIAVAQDAAAAGMKNRLATTAATKVMELEVAARAKVIKSLTELTDKQDATGLKSLVLEERFKSLSDGLKTGSKDVADYVAVTHSMIASRGANIDGLDKQRNALVANSDVLQEAVKLSKTFNISLLTVVEALNSTRIETNRVKEGYDGFNKVLQESIDLVELQYTGLNALERAQAAMSSIAIGTAFYNPNKGDTAIQKLYNDLIEAREALAEAEKAGDAERIVSLSKVKEALQERWDAEVNPKSGSKKSIKRDSDLIAAPKADSYTENATKAWAAYNKAISDADKAQKLFGSGVDTSGSRIEAMKDLIWNLDDGTAKYTDTVKLLISQLKLLEGAQMTGATATEELTFKQQQGKIAMEATNSAINNAAVGGFSALGQAMADAATGADTFGNSLLKGTMSALGSGLQQIGSALIAYGIAMEAFKKAFTNPFLAIGAGVALVAAGAVLTNSISKMSSTGSSSQNLAPKKTGSTGGISMINGAGYNAATGSSAGLYSGDGLAVQVQGEFKLKGNDLVASINKTGQKTTRF